jgi:hypothetical protein
LFGGTQEFTGDTLNGEAFACEEMLICLIIAGIRDGPPNLRGPISEVVTVVQFGKRSVPIRGVTGPHILMKPMG